MNIIYEDNHLFVLNKPAALLTQPSGTDRRNLEDEAKAWIKKRDQKPGGVYLEAAHRIDKSASGIVVFAKTSKALSRLKRAFAGEEIEKIYYAIIEGIPQRNKDYLKHYLRHASFVSEEANASDVGAKSAKLYYHLLKTKGGFSLLEVHLVTGRYHQIRSQLSLIGCPILGDVKYGARHAFKPNEIALHHLRVLFPHPVTKEKMAFDAPFPSHWPKFA